MNSVIYMNEWHTDALKFNNVTWIPYKDTWIARYPRICWSTQMSSRALTSNIIRKGLDFWFLLKCLSGVELRPGTRKITVNCSKSTININKSIRIFWCGKDRDLRVHGSQTPTITTKENQYEYRLNRSCTLKQYSRVQCRIPWCKALRCTAV